MPSPLYLDTARLGLMSPRARRVYRDFVEFVGEAGLDLYAEDLLRHGGAALPESFRERFPALAGWSGIDGFRDELRRVVGLPSESPVLVAGRTALLMQLASRLLFRLCRNVLTVDFTWPAYSKTLLREAAPSRNRITTVSLREAVFEDRISEAEIVQRLTSAAVREGCDGLFLPMVSHDGVRLPVEAISRATALRAGMRCVVIDGAQAFCHVPIELSGEWCDLFFTGSHKWPGAYHPLGLAFCGRSRTVSAIRSRLLAETHDDPLLALLHGFDTGRRNATGETVNVGPLFSCQGALADARAGNGVQTECRKENAGLLAEAVRTAGWRVRAPAESLRTAILLAEPARAPARGFDPEAVRRTFLRHGLTATAYPEGRVRLSAPQHPLTGGDLSSVVAGLRSAG